MKTCNMSLPPTNTFGILVFTNNVKRETDGRTDAYCEHFIIKLDYYF